MHIAAVALLVPDYDAGLSFYAGGLGFVITSDEDQGNGKRWVTVRPPGGQTDLLLARAVNDTQHAAIGNQTGGRVGFFLRSDDFAATLATLKSAGAILHEVPRSEPYGQVVVWSDPFGNKWDLLGPPAPDRL
jgi:catechol 2,3-dioxygenase-like lactoylglutathione lyase family enzyme